MNGRNGKVGHTWIYVVEYPNLISFSIVAALAPLWSTVLTQFWHLASCLVTELHYAY